jgi:neutral ceramidase
MHEHAVTKPSRFDGTLHVGAARTNLLGQLPQGFHVVAGYGPLAAWSATESIRVVEPLHATAVVIAGANHERVALVVCDLHSGTEAVTRLVAQALAHSGRAWWTVDRIVLMATHTHGSVGGIFRVQMYDKNASSRPDFSENTARALAVQIALAVGNAEDALAPATLDLHVGALSGWWSNRSLAAFENNEIPLQEAIRELHADSSLPAECLAVDPRISSMVFRERRNNSAQKGDIIAVLSAVGAHCSAGNPLKLEGGADSFGVAATEATRLVQQLQPGANKLNRGLCATYISAGADANVEDPAAIRAFLAASKSRGEAFARAVEEDHQRALPQSIGKAIANEIVKSVRTAPTQTSNQSSAVTVRLATLSMDKAVKQRVLGPPRVGTAARGLSEFGRYFLLKMGSDFDDFLTSAMVLLSRSVAAGQPEGKLFDTSGNPLQTPKKGGNDIMSIGLRGDVASRVMLRVIDIGGLRLATVPFEVSTTLGLQIVAALEAQATTPVRALFATVAGGYASYAVTQDEYMEQHYEGASTLWGSPTGSWLTEQVLKLAASKATPQRPEPCSFGEGS